MAKVMIGCRILESNAEKLISMAKKIDSATTSVTSIAVDILNETVFASELVRINKTVNATVMTRIRASGAIIYNTGGKVFALCLNDYQAEFVKARNKEK